MQGKYPGALTRDASAFVKALHQKSGRAKWDERKEILCCPSYRDLPVLRNVSDSKLELGELRSGQSLETASSIWPQRRGQDHLAKHWKVEIW